MRTIVAAFVAVIGCGTLGYMVFGGLRPLDALYMAVITISTVGYSDEALGTAGRVFSIVYIIGGVFVGAATVTAVAATIVEGRIRDVLGRRRMQRQISLLDNHVILCGFGRFGQLAAQELKLGNVPFVVIELHDEAVDQAEGEDIHVLHGDATEEEALEAAGIERARAMMCTLPNDAQNVYAILSARELRSANDGHVDDFPIVVLARERRAERKLRVAGATHVVQPYEIGAHHMAQQIISPHVARMMGQATDRSLEAKGVRMREFPVQPGAVLDGVALRDSPVRRDFNVMIVGVIEARDGESRYNPGPDYVVRAGDVLVAVGPTDGLVKLRKATGMGTASTVPAPPDGA